MDDLERDLLRFAAAHRLICGDQVTVLAGGKDHDDPIARTRWLVGEGLLSRVRLTPTAPDCFMVTEAGLAAIDSPLAAPAWEMRGLREVLAAGWVWVRSQDGRFTGLTDIVSRREMVFHDSELTNAIAHRRGVRCGRMGSGSRGAIRRTGLALHHPDVLLEVH